MKAFDREDYKLCFDMDRLHQLYVDEFKKGCGYGCPNNMPNNRVSFCIPPLCFVDWLEKNGYIEFKKPGLHEIVEKSPDKE